MCEVHQHGVPSIGTEKQPWWKEQRNLIIALVLFFALMIYKFGFDSTIIPPWGILGLNLIAYYFAGWSVLSMAARKISHGDFFNEFVLMSVATIGAFLIQEYEEGVAVMLFYQTAE